MFGSTGSLPAKDQRPMGQDYRRSATNQEGRVLPLLFGRQRVGCTFISDFFDIRSESVSTGGKSGTKAGTNYYASFAVAVCHGIVNAFHDLYLNGEPVFASSTKLYAVSLTETNNIATFQTKNPHGLQSGDTVIINGAEQPEFNGEFTVTVVSPTQFQYTIPGTSLTTETATHPSKIYALVKLAPIYSNGADSTTITIPDFGTATIYWGTETQTADAYLSGVSGIRHPPYKGICYIVFHQLFLGFNQTNAQNVEVVVERTPSFDWMSDMTHAVINGDANPGCITADLLLNKRAGLACDEVDDVNTDTLDAGIEQFFSENVGLSPLITRPDELRSQFLSVLQVVDAAPVIDDDGKLALALQRLLSAPLTVNDSNLADLPNVSPGDWSGVINETQLTFLDRDSGWQSDFVTWKDDAGIYAKDRPEPQTLDWELVTHRDLALILVAIAGQLAALPTRNGKLKLAFNTNLFAALAPGNAFQLQYSARPALNGLYRVTSRSLTDPAQPVFEIEISVDRSYLYSQVLSNTSASKSSKNVVTKTGQVKTNEIIKDAVAPPLAPIPVNTRYTIFELPAALCPGEPAVAALVARDDSSTNSASLWIGTNYDWSGEAVSSFSQLASITKFAWHGALLADYSGDTNTIDLRAGLVVQLDGPDVVLPDSTPFDALCDKLLVFIGNEILSVSEAVFLDTGRYLLRVVRGRFATPVESHNAGDKVLIATRDAVVPLAHPQFQPGNVAQFKLTLADQDLADVDAFDVGILGTAWRVPPPSALAINGATRNAVFSGAGAFEISWTLPDAGAPLPRFDVMQMFTLLEFLIAGSVVHSEKVQWPTNSLSIAWATVSDLPAQDFTLRATTIVRTAFNDIAGWPVTLAVSKL